MTNRDISEAKILVLSHDDELREFLQVLIAGEGYQYSDCTDEQNILSCLTEKSSELLLIDLETVNAIEVSKKIRANFTLRHIPILLMVSKEHTIEKIKGIYAGADDYIEKPLQAGELLTRIKANLWRANRDLDANPLTKLPGNVTILKELEKRIKNKNELCMGYIDLNKFKEYNDYYGFEFGDNVIKHTAKVVSDALIELGEENDFLGHIGGDDYIFITGWDNIETICQKIIDDFDKTIISFYKKEDLEKGYIIVKNRAGKVTASSILSIAIGVATNKQQPLEHVGKVIQVATELKSYAKTFGKSVYVIDRRND